VSRGGIKASGPEQGPEVLLRVRGLEARYGPIAAVRGVDLDVRRGEIVALLGANGAGKTSTLAAIVGLLPGRSGTVEFEGRNVMRLPPEKIVRRGIALTPEGRRLFATLTVAENLSLGGADEATRERLLELFPVLRERLAAPAGALSGGEQQQLAIARSLMSRPRLLLLDEPTLGLAPKLIAAVFELIVRLRDEDGVSILLVEQNVHRALDVCDRAYVMRTGTIEATGTPAELRGAGVERAYLGVI
jgi:branched-chain amino acid transport system ATP-binding protein